MGPNVYLMDGPFSSHLYNFKNVNIKQPKIKIIHGKLILSKQ